MEGSPSNQEGGLAKRMDGNLDVTLSEMASRFFSSLSPEKRQESLPKITKFIRWCGRDRIISRLTGREVEEYALGQRGSSGAGKNDKHIKAFLSFSYKQGVTKSNLSSSYKPRKSTVQATSSRRRQTTLTHLTKEGYEKIQAELKELKGLRGQLATDILKAAADKDFRENAPLEAARERQGQVESKIRELEETINSAVVLEKGQARAQEVRASIGNSVSVKDLSNGEDLVYMLVAPTEARLADGKLSIESPVGKALLGRGAGEEVEVQVPAGTFRYRIEGINS